MPQFDFYSFATQVFWLFFCFFVFYYFILYYYISKYSEVLKLRSKLKNLSYQLKLRKEKKPVYDFIILKLIDSFKK